MLVYPKAQTKWLWIIAAYLFLAGVGGGAYLLGVAADLIGGEQWTFLSKAGIILGFPCVAIGAALLIFDLGTPKNFWRAAMKPGTSWMARGVIILSIFMILGVIHIAFWIWPFPNVLEGAEGARQILSIVGAVFALAVMIYTGLLLEASRPIAFWGAAILPELFLVSALSTGLMGVVLIGSIGGAAKTTILTFEKIYILLNVFELIALGFFMQATHRVTESRISAELVLRGAVVLVWRRDRWPHCSPGARDSGCDYSGGHRGPDRGIYLCPHRRTVSEGSDPGRGRPCATEGGPFRVYADQRITCRLGYVLHAVM